MWLYHREFKMNLLHFKPYFFLQIISIFVIFKKNIESGYKFLRYKFLISFLTNFSYD